jgi:hypothetical protein
MQVGTGTKKALHIFPLCGMISGNALAPMVRGATSYKEKFGGN